MALTLDPADAAEKPPMGSCVPAPASGSDDVFEICNSAAAVAVLRGNVANRACKPAELVCNPSELSIGCWSTNRGKAGGGRTGAHTPRSEPQYVIAHDPCSHVLMRWHVVMREMCRRCSWATLTRYGLPHELQPTSSSVMKHHTGYLRSDMFCVSKSHVEVVRHRLGAAEASPGCLRASAQQPARRQRGERASARRRKA